ncbi:hypothetical protein GCM10027052_29960 [Parafrigoribacterium mesophilum]|uniref:hypothetical protein n=1 Tax=Parafrigoribacterium mesophilum TaxID=433646 RepID=UPI0031FC8C88
MGQWRVPTSAPLAPPLLGLLLDVDGPIASPITRTIAIPSIVTDLVTLAAAGVPIAFITGRSDTFLRDQVVAPLLNAGLSPTAGMFGVCEKGGVWFPITASGMGAISIDDSIAVPQDYTDDLRNLVANGFSDTMFFDDTKHVMISIEQRRDVPHARYVAAQPAMNEAAFELLVRHGLGARLGDRERADAAGRVPFRVDPTIISTDVESVTLDKDRGAERALAFFSQVGPLPKRWRSMGDSRSDYLMADHLYAAGFEVAHVDVRPSDGILDRPYRVVVEGDAIHDEAGAAFLSHWVEKLGLR